MFERNRVDTNSTEARVGVPVEVTLDDGRVLRGKFRVGKTRNIYDVLNSTNAFLDFEPYVGESMLIAKSTLREIKLTGVPQAGQLAHSVAHSHGFDPYTVLGIERGADYAAVREAYHRLAMAYHPDRYANAELPDEVRDYLASMARRINAAYAALEEPLQVKRQVMKAKTEPIYVSPGRA